MEEQSNLQVKVHVNAGEGPNNFISCKIIAIRNKKGIWQIGEEFIQIKNFNQINPAFSIQKYF